MFYTVLSASKREYNRPTESTLRMHHCAASKSTSSWKSDYKFWICYDFMLLVILSNNGNKLYNVGDIVLQRVKLANT